jgi:hypothetical protein
VWLRRPRGGVWCALVVFRAELSRHASREDAIAHVLAGGLAALSAHWILRGIDEDGDQIVCIQEANAHSVTVVLDFYPIPGVPTLTITSSELADGSWTLHRC